MRFDDGGEIQADTAVEASRIMTTYRTLRASPLTRAMGIGEYDASFSGPPGPLPPLRPLHP